MINFETEHSALGKLFQKAEAELNETAKKYGFTLKLTENLFSDTWFYHPQVEANWTPEKEGETP